MVVDLIFGKYISIFLEMLKCFKAVGLKIAAWWFVRYLGYLVIGYQHISL